MSSNNHSNNHCNSDGPRTGTVALLKLPIHTTISLDGSGSNTLRKEEDILVIRDIPIGFHLFTLKAGNTSKNANDNTNANDTSLSMAMPIGLVVLFSSDSNYDNFVAREYNVRTEELSAGIDPITAQNLKNILMAQNQAPPNGFIDIDASKIIHYSNFTAVQPHATTVGDADADGATVGATVGAGNGSHSNIWTACLTQYISRKVLERHSLTGSGDKIIPGAYSLALDNDNDNDNDYVKGDDTNGHASCIKQNDDGCGQDGLTMEYMPIPVIDNDNAIDDAKHQTGKAHNHSGTRRYLASLSPSQRTAFFMNQRDTSQQQRQRPADALFHKILKDYYDDQWEVLIGEMQLSFCIFIKCSCLKSLEHWRDIIYMLSLVSGETIRANHKQQQLERLYYAFMVTVKHQLEHFDCSIFHEEEFAGGNVFMPAIQRIAKTCMDMDRNDDAASSIGNKGGDNHCGAMQHIASELLTLTMTRFEMDTDPDGDNVKSKNRDPSSKKSYANDTGTCMAYGDIEMNSSDDDEEDGPVIVAMEEVQASLERIAALPRTNLTTDDTLQFRGQYPFLFAAVSNAEDIIMACARILDEQRDVTLVREAASYLEDVEAKR